MRDIFESKGVMGCSYRPCINTDHFDRADLPLLSEFEQKKAEFYEIIDLQETCGPCQIENLIRKVGCSYKNCERDDIVTAFHCNGSPWFFRSDLHNLDFQYFNEHHDHNGNMHFRLTHNIYIVSSKVMNLINQKGIKGFRIYYTDPPIAYCVVETDESVVDLN